MSKRLSLNKSDLPALLKSLGVGAGIALLTYLSEFLTHVDFGSWSTVVMGVIPPLLTAAIRFLRNNEVVDNAQ